MTAGKEGQPEDKVERGEETLDYSEERPHQEEEVDEAGADLEKGQGAGRLRREWKEEEEEERIQNFLKIEIHRQVQVEQLLQAEKGQSSAPDWAIKN